MVISECSASHSARRGSDSVRRTYRYINQFDPEGVSYQIVGQDDGALQSCIGPSLFVCIGDIEARNGDCLDLVGRLWNRPFHGLLVGVRQD